MNYLFILNIIFCGFFFFGCNKPVAGDKYLVVTPQGGLANRLRVMASAAVAAQNSGRKLVLDWQGSGGVPAPFEKLFSNSYPAPSEIYIPGTGELHKILSEPGNNEKILKQYTLTSNDVENYQLFYGPLAKIHEETLAIVHISSWTNFKPASLSFDQFWQEYADFYRQLKPIPAVQQKIDEAKLTLFSSGKRIVGIHLRSFLFEFGKRLYTTQMFEPFLDQALSENPDTEFFLSTDEHDTQAIFKAKYGNNRIHSFSTSQIERNTVLDIQNALVDFYLLGATDYIIGTYQSSFSEEAATLSKSGKRIPVGPSLIKYYHSIICFNQEGKAFERPDILLDPCNFDGGTVSPR